MLASQAVHTTGVNVESVLVIIGSVVASMGIIFGWIEKRNKQNKDQITQAVSNLQIVLLEKLETKEAVNALKVEITRLATRQDMYMSQQQTGTAA